MDIKKIILTQHWSTPSSQSSDPKRKKIEKKFHYAKVLSKFHPSNENFQSQLLFFHAKVLSKFHPSNENFQSQLLHTPSHSAMTEIKIKH
jgi:hypothetical protein